MAETNNTCLRLLSVSPVVGGHSVSHVDLLVVDRAEEWCVHSAQAEFSAENFTRCLVTSINCIRISLGLAGGVEGRIEVKIRVDWFSVARFPLGTGLFPETVHAPSEQEVTEEGSLEKRLSLETH